MTHEDILARLESAMAFDGGQKFRLPDGFVREIDRLRDDIEADIEASPVPILMGAPPIVGRADLASMADQLTPVVKAAFKAKRPVVSFVLTPALIALIVQLVIQAIAFFVQRNAAFALPLHQAQPDEIDPVVMTAVQANS